MSESNPNINAALAYIKGAVQKPRLATAKLPPVRVAVTGAAGAIGYSLITRIARLVVHKHDGRGFFSSSEVCFVAHLSTDE
jgi:hypothetical protein